MTDVSDQMTHFLSPASFWVPERIVESAWLRHAPFAFWLIQSTRPNVVVELGTHHGFSYFCFCQAAERVLPVCRLTAVDTWQGDPQAGYYGEDVFANVNAYNVAHYQDRSTLLRMRFLDALGRFADGSIDLLHIDGAHDYEDVRSDFEAWLPKLSARGVVLFHDVAVEREGFGVKRLWIELSHRYPHFTFFHGFGLGVLGVGHELPAALGQLLALAPASSAAEHVRDAYARLGLTVELDHDLHVGAQMFHSRQAALETKSALPCQELPLSSAEGATPPACSEIVGALAQCTDELRNHIGSAFKEAVAFSESLMRQLDHTNIHLASERARVIGLSDEIARLRIVLADSEQQRVKLEAAKSTAIDELRQTEASVGRLHADMVDAEAAVAHLKRNGWPLVWLSTLLRCKVNAVRLYRSPLFDSDWYVEAYMKRNTSRLSAIEHFLREGLVRGCMPNRLFDTRWYLTKYDDVRRSGVNPLLHYLAEGWTENRNPGPGFDTQFYLEHNPDVAKSRMNPLAHYLRFGRKEGRLPAPTGL